MVLLWRQAGDDAGKIRPIPLEVLRKPLRPRFLRFFRTILCGDQPRIDTIEMQTKAALLQCGFQEIGIVGAGHRQGAVKPFQKEPAIDPFINPNLPVRQAMNAMVRGNDWKVVAFALS